MKRIFTGLLAVILLAVILLLSSCGCSDNQTFTVDHIEFVYDWSTSDIDLEGELIEDNSSLRFSLVGEYKGKEESFYISSFKDCTLESFSFLETDRDGVPSYELIKESSLTKTYKLDGGITLTLKDADGKIHRVNVDSGSEFEVDDSKAITKLLLPE